MEEDKKKKIVIKKKKPIVKVKIKGKKDDHEEETHAHGTTETKETTSESSEIRTEKTSSSENKSTEQRNTYQGNRDNRGGGYQGNRDNRGGGYQGNRDNRGGGFQGNRDNRGGGYQGNRDNRGGGFQGNRDNRGGGYQGNRDNRGGGFQGNRDNRGGGYQGNRDNRGGGFQNKDGRPNQGGGGGGDFRKKREEKSDNFAPILDKKNFRGGDWKNKKKNKEQDFLDREEEEKNFEIQRKQKQMASAIPTEVEIPDTILVKDLAKKMNIKSGDLIAKLMSMGYMATINDALDKETTEIIASEFGCKVIIHSLYDELQKLESFQDDDISGDITRPPVVTVMGHVDHGKTSLLDYIRNAAVAAKEAGGITQHIGAYQVEIPKGKITFIDTPGHEAFTRMRERGAAATDIVILVVAADDGVMPQTIEALNHAKAAGVPIIVAMNKIDKPSANPDRVKQQLAEHDLVPEDWGGKTQFIPVSALKGTGVNELLEAVLLEAEMKELKANPKKKAKAIILEAQVDKGKGPVATIIIKDGTLKKGDIFVAGIESNKVRAMFDYTGKQIKEAPPSMPIEVIGFDILPEAGEVLRVVDSEKKAKEIVDKKKEIKWLEHAKKVTKKASLDDLYQQYQQGQKTDFNIIVKADVQGTAEAIKTMIEKFGAKINEVNLRVLHTGVGAITENDVELASASKAVIIGFNVRPNPKAADLAKVKGVEIRKYSIIYKIVDELKDAIEGVLKPEEKEVILGQLEVRNTFKVSKVGTVAGCYVTEGIVKRNSSVRVIREGVVIHSGKIEALKRFKDDAKEVSAGFECGITLVNFNDIKEKDTFEAFEIQEIAKKLELND